MDLVSTSLRILATQKLQDKCEVQGRNLASLEERCSSLKSTIDQLNLTLERANTGEAEMRAEIQSLQRTLLDTSSTSHSSTERLKQVRCSIHDTSVVDTTVSELTSLLCLILCTLFFICSFRNHWPTARMNAGLSQNVWKRCNRCW
jgi:predicted  nucleic acid-binding Zn-ribbon protein